MRYKTIKIPTPITIYLSVPMKGLTKEQIDKIGTRMWNALHFLYAGHAPQLQRNYMSDFPEGVDDDEEIWNYCLYLIKKADVIACIKGSDKTNLGCLKEKVFAIKLHKPIIEFDLTCNPIVMSFYDINNKI